MLLPPSAQFQSPSMPVTHLSTTIQLVFTMSQNVETPQILLTTVFLLLVTELMKIPVRIIGSSRIHGRLPGEMLVISALHATKTTCAVLQLWLPTPKSKTKTTSIYNSCQDMMICKLLSQRLISAFFA